LNDKFIRLKNGIEILNDKKVSLKQRGYEVLKVWNIVCLKPS